MYSFKKQIPSGYVFIQQRPKDYRFDSKIIKLKWCKSKLYLWMKSLPVVWLLSFKTLWLSVTHEKCRKSPGLPRSFLPSDLGVSEDRGVTKRREVKPTVSAAETHLCNLAELQGFSFRETCLLVVTVNQTWGVTVWPAVGNKGWKCHRSSRSLYSTKCIFIWSKLKPLALWPINMLDFYFEGFLLCFIMYLPCLCLVRPWAQPLTLYPSLLLLSVFFNISILDGIFIPCFNSFKS